MTLPCLQYQPEQLQQRRKVLTTWAGMTLGLTLSGCTVVTTYQYEATALVTYTWRVEYAIDPQQPKTTRVESFQSTSLLNRNGLKPEGAITGPDDRGLWWPALPPRPFVDEIEQHQRSLEKVGTPRIFKTVKYQLTYRAGDETVTLPANYQVYRQVAKAAPAGILLEITLSLGNASVLKAEPR